MVEVFKLDTWVMCSWCGESLHHTCGIERIPFHSKHHNLLEPSKIQKLPSHQKSSVWGLAPPKVHFSSNINNYCRLVCSIWNITVMTPIFLWVEPCLDHAPVTVKLMAQWLPIKHPQSKYVRWNPPTYCGPWINAMGSGKQSHTSTGKLGNRLTRRPCKGDEFEIPIFEAKRQNAGICRSRQKMLATWTFISIGRRVTQEWKFAFRLRGDSILLFKGQKKTLEIYDFQSSESYQGDIHSSSFFLFSTLAVPDRLWQRRSHSLQQGSVVTPCPALGPSVPFLVHVLVFLVEHRRRSPFFQVFPCSIHLLSTSNNGSIGIIPQTTSKMISLSLSKEIFCLWLT